MEKIVSLMGKTITLDPVLQNRDRVIIAEPRHSLIDIDRTTLFDPTLFISKGGTIWKGPIDGDGLRGEEAQDRGSLALANLDLIKVRFETCLEEGESYLVGEVRLARLKKKGYIRLDAKTFLTLWKNQHLIPPQWKELTNGNTTYIFFDGTELRNPEGKRYTLYLYWLDDKWHWSYYWLENDRDASDPSAVLVN